MCIRDREYIAAPFARAGIVDGDCFPAGKLALCRSGRTGPLGFVLLSEQGASGSGKDDDRQRTHNDCDFAHADSSNRTTKSQGGHHVKLLSGTCHLMSTKKKNTASRDRPG